MIISGSDSSSGSPYPQPDGTRVFFQCSDHPNLPPLQQGMVQPLHITAMDESYHEDFHEGSHEGSQEEFEMVDVYQSKDIEVCLKDTPTMIY